ncbi:MAG: hypothetical protein OHK0045_08070 [Raineya sp.]
MNYLQKAQSEGLLRITQNEVIYSALGQSFPISPEESVRAAIFAKILFHYGYPPQRIVFEYPVKMGSSYKRVDIVIFADDAKQKPFCIVECKKANIGESTFSEAIEQAFSYDNHLYANYLWITSGKQEIFFKSEHTNTGRKRYELNDIPKFTFQDQIWYRAFETFQIAWGFVNDIYTEFFAPTLKTRWFARLMLFLAIFMLCNYLMSWANIQWLTPYAIQNKWLQGSYHFKHLFWISTGFSTLLASWLLRHSLIPDDLLSASKALEKAKQRNNWVLIASILILIPSFFWIELFFDYDTKYCFGCKPCSSEWRCWWSFAHFKLYPRAERIWEYLLPSWVLLGVQATTGLLVAWLLKIYAQIR